MNQPGIGPRLLVRFYRYSEPILKSLTGLRVLASLISLFLVVYYYGFPHSPAGSATLIFLTQSMFGFFVFSYLMRAIFSMHAWRYIKDTLFIVLLNVHFAGNASMCLLVCSALLDNDEAILLHK